MSQSRQAHHASTSSRDDVPSKVQIPFQRAVGCIFKGREQCAWAAWYNTWLLNRLTLKGIVSSLVSSAGHDTHGLLCQVCL